MTELILSNGECNTHQVPTKLSDRMCHCVSRIQQSTADRNPRSKSGPGGTGLNATKTAGHGTASRMYSVATQSLERVSKPTK